MRKYEIVMLVHPDQSEQVPAMVDRYRKIVEADGGQVGYEEDWGRRQLAYTIDKLHKAHYYMMMVECSQAAMEEIETSFKFNDAILRKLVLSIDDFSSVASPLAKEREEDDKRKASAAARQASRNDEKSEPKPAEPAADQPKAAETADA